MPRRNINADERIDRSWSPEFIRAFMKKLKGNVEDKNSNKPAVRKNTGKFNNKNSK